MMFSPLITLDRLNCLNQSLERSVVIVNMKHLAYYSDGFHYENMSMQYTEIIVTFEKFQYNFFFLFLLKT